MVMKGSCSALAALLVLSTAAGQIVGVARQQRNEFSITVVDGNRPGGSTAPCSVLDGQQTTPGPVRFLVQNGTIATFNLGTAGGYQLTQINSTAPGSPYVTQSGSGSQASVSYTASGYASPMTTLNYGLQQGQTTVCTFSLTLGADLATGFTFDGSTSQNISLSPFAPSGADPRRNCFSTGLRADSTVQGPFYILVPSGRTVTLSSTVPLIFETAAGSAPGAMVVANNGNQFVSASFTAAPATLPTQLNLSLGSPAQCGITVYFVPLSGS